MGLHTHRMGPQQREFFDAYFGQLVGATIIDFAFLEDDGEHWPAFKARLASGQIVQFEIHQDEEGNGPGWISGLDIEAAQKAAQKT